jgi:hypothetical protein
MTTEIHPTQTKPQESTLEREDDVDSVGSASVAKERARLEDVDFINSQIGLLTPEKGTKI